MSKRYNSHMADTHIQSPIEQLIISMGQAGKRLSEIEACEGAAGNLSILIGWEIEPGAVFPRAQKVDLPGTYPQLGGYFVLATGSGRRLREIETCPQSNLGLLKIEKDGRTGTLFTAGEPGITRLTSELNSHLATHQMRVQQAGVRFHHLVHAQPLHLTFLSQVPRYQEQRRLNQHILRWQPEAILNFPEGVGLIEYMVPGSDALAQATAIALQAHKLVIWSKHGVIARSDASLLAAVDLIEYAETSARYEVLNLACGDQAEGLSREEILAICTANQLKQSVYHP
jgi:rhamnulose-1-phosphate aldolase